MITFLPLESFVESAKVLDNRRLGKQRVEALQILLCNKGTTPLNWQNHPATRQWKSHEDALCLYGIAICAEWRRRGFMDNCLNEFHKRVKNFDPPMPQWLGDDRLHSSHRAALLAKDFDHYKQFQWTEEPKIAYYWPSQLQRVDKALSLEELGLNK